MGVKVTRKYSDGRASETTEYVCFGFLSSPDDRNAHVTEIQYHYTYGRNNSWPNVEDYVKAMAEIFAGNPMFKHCKVHPRKGVVSVKNVENIPCDQLMACLFAARNMAQHGSNIKTYQFLRSVGYSPIVSFTVCQSFNRKPRLSSLDREDQRWSRLSQSESSIFHQATFGELAFKRMVRQGYSKKVFNPWRQESFTAQRRYLRDSYIHQEQGAVTHRLSGNGTLMSRGDTSHSNYMAFCFTDFSGKEKPLIQGGNISSRLGDPSMLAWINSMLPKHLRVEVPESGAVPAGTIGEGVVVRMSMSGSTRYSSQTNPNNRTSLGTVRSMSPGGRVYVRWDLEGYSNTYDLEDLVLHSPS